MEAVYSNGERVYLMGDAGGKIIDNIEEAKRVLMVKHNDIVEKINDVFRCVRDGHHDIGSFPAKSLLKIMRIFSDLPVDLKAWEIPCIEVKYKNINFQNREKANGLAKQARRLTIEHIDGLNAGGLRVIKGSLPILQEEKVNEESALSDEFKAWRQALRLKNKNAQR